MQNTEVHFHPAYEFHLAVAVAVAVAGYLPPVAGAISQEAIDVIAVPNALRVATPPKSLTDFPVDRGE